MTTSSPTTPDGRLAAFVADTTTTNVPDEAVRASERAFVDTVGVTLPGVDEPAADAVRRVFGGGAGGTGAGEATVLGTGTTTAASEAALVNATAGHALDYDDVTGNAWHPSVTLVAPALAVGERVGASGADLVTAYAVGFEAEAYLAAFVQPEHYERGWHATGTFGTVGATAAAASLLDLDAETARHALNVAASMPSGLKANFGTMTKPLHAGLAARNGVTAALLADAGTTAAAGALGDDGGFCDLYGGGADPSARTPSDPGDPWALLTQGISVKRYPCCYYAHAGIAATQHLANDHDLEPPDVEGIEVTLSPGAADALHYADPDTGLEAKFSMEYTVASALARDRVGLAAFADDAVDEPTVQAVRERVDVSVDPDLGYDTFGATVAVTTTDGDRYRRVQSEPPGTPERPLSDDELRAKFEAAAGHASVAVDATEAFALLDDLRDVSDVGDLVAVLSPGRDA